MLIDPVNQLPDKLLPQLTKTVHNDSLPLFTFLDTPDDPLQPDFTELFGGQLLYVIDTKTGTKFLADTGSIPNLIMNNVVKTKYPRSWEERQPLDMKLRGIGGSSHVDYLVIIDFDGLSVPFATGKGVPLNIVGFKWIDQVQQLPNIATEFKTPSNVNEELSLLTLYDDISCDERDGTKVGSSLCKTATDDGMMEAANQISVEPARWPLSPAVAVGASVEMVVTTGANDEL